MQWRIQDFNCGGGGGGAKDYVRAHTSRTRSPKSFTAGFQGPHKGLGSSGLCSLLLFEPYFKNSDTKRDKKQTTHRRTVGQDAAKLRQNYLFMLSYLKTAVLRVI